MKSIIKTKSEKMLLTVNIPSDQNEILSGIMASHGGKVITALSSDGGKQLGYLLGFGGFEKNEKPQREVSQSCVVFSGVGGSELNEILRQMREAGVVVALKAVCTAYNQSWTLADLAIELDNEHKAMTGGGKGE